METPNSQKIFQELNCLMEYSREVQEGKKNKILDFIRQQVEKRKTDGGLVCISGGLDSALTATLVKEALGKEKTYGLTLRHPEFKRTDLIDAINIGKQLGLNYEIKKVNGIFRAYRRRLAGFDLQEPFNYLHLIQMITSSLALAEARKRNYTVISTGNRTEYLAGMLNIGGNIAEIFPLGDLMKTEVRSLAKFCNISQAIQDKIPSDGLRNNKSDEEILGLPYEKLDALTYCLEQGVDITEIEKMYGVPREKILEIKSRGGAAKLKLSFPICEFKKKPSDEALMVLQLSQEKANLEKKVQDERQEYQNVIEQQKREYSRLAEQLEELKKNLNKSQDNEKQEKQKERPKQPPKQKSEDTEPKVIPLGTRGYHGGGGGWSGYNDGGRGGYGRGGYSGGG